MGLLPAMYTEWTVLDTETQALKLCRAKNQREALRKGLELGVFPQTTNHVRPREIQQSSSNEIMSVEEFQDLIEQIT